MSYKNEEEQPLRNDVTIEADDSDLEADDLELLNRLDPLQSTQSATQRANPIVTSISSNSISDRRYKGSNTLDEPVSTTILNDVRAIGHKLQFVLWPAGDAHNREWDLWVGLSDEFLSFG